MALWAGSTLNNNVASALMNLIYSKEAIDVVSEASGLIFSLYQKEQKQNQQFDFAKSRIEKISGDQLRVRFFGGLTSIPTIADGAAEIAGVTPSYNAAAFGAGLFDLTHHYQVFGVPNSEIDRIRGQEAATANWLADRVMEYTASLRDTLGTGINAAVVGATRTVLGNWQHAVSDGTTNVAGFNETLLKTYGTLDRSDAANSILRGNIKDMNSVAWTLDDIDVQRVRCNRRNSMAKGVDLAAMGETQYLRAVSLLNAKPTVLISQDENWRKWGGQYFSYAGITFTYEPKLGNDRFGIFDTSTWALWDEKPNELVKNAFIKLPTSPADACEVEKWNQLVCVSPANNSKFIRCV